MNERVLDPSDPYCPRCGHNRDTSCVSSIDEGSGRKSCQMCGSEWSECQQGARMKYEYIGEQSITIHGNGEAGARMSDIELPTDAEGQDLGWHALNYRTAHTMHAQAMYEELERYVRAAILAERERCIRIAEGDYEHLTVGIDPHASVGRMIAAAIRR